MSANLSALSQFTIRYPQPRARLFSSLPQWKWMAFQKLARLDDVPPGHTKFVYAAGGAPVILANYQGQVHALHGLCAHQQKPLDGAILWDNLLDCPWHHFQYDVRTGQNHFPSNVYPEDLPWLKTQVQPLRVYPVKVEDGDIWVDLQAL